MTLPALVNKYREKTTVVQVKKFYSMFSQAYLRAVNDNGTMDLWGLGNSEYELDEDDNKVLTADTRERRIKFFEIMKPYIKFDEKSMDGTNGYALPDGIRIVALWLNSAGCIADANTVCGNFYITTDGKNYLLPGQQELTKNNKKTANTFCFNLYRNRVEPFGVNDDNVLQHYCANGNNYSYCTAWVVYNENMDYLHCKDLSWNGKKTCK